MAEVYLLIHIRISSPRFSHLEMQNHIHTTNKMHINVHKTRYHNSESTKQMEEKLNFQVPSEGLELVILLHTQY